MNKTWPALALSAILFGACVSSPPTASDAEPRGEPEIPPILEIVCHEDGSTDIAHTDVRTSPDGVHVRVDNRSGEAVTVNGIGLDFNDGVTEQVARSEPGEVKVACWPGSKHSEPEPSPVPVQIHDPEGHWTDSELECPKDDLVATDIRDYVSDAEGLQGEPEDLARQKIRYIQETDTVATVGYPDAEQRQVAVVRDGRTIAIVSFFEASGGGWLIGASGACDSARMKI